MRIVNREGERPKPKSRSKAQSPTDRLVPSFTIHNSRLAIYHGCFMDIEAEIWVRGEEHATTQLITSVERQPGAWTEVDVSKVLVGMLRALDRAKNPDADQDRPVALRGFSWIVNPFENRGVVIAIEMGLGAIVAGPFDIAERDLSTLIERVMAAERPPQSRAANETIH